MSSTSFNCDKCPKTYKTTSSLKRHIKQKHNIPEIPEIPIQLEQLPIANSFIEVCSGAGGLSKGLILAGFNPILLNDNNADCCATLRRNHQNHPNIIIRHESMTTLDLTEYNDRIDLLCGGIPCQSFSHAGKRGGLEDPRGDLMLKFADLIRQVSPKIFMIENVKGLLSHAEGATLERIIEHLNVDGQYNIVYKLLNSVNYGVPQKRERVFIIGIKRIYEREFIFPVINPDEPIKTVSDALLDVPDSPGVGYSEAKLRLFRLIPQGGCWVDLPEEEQHAYLGASINSGGGKRGILYRLAMDKPSLTLLCTPTQKQTERCHPLEDRPLRVREYARIQSFPDDYEFSGSMASKYKQIGNAVPVELARRMGVALLEYLQQL